MIRVGLGVGKRRLRGGEVGHEAVPRVLVHDVREQEASGSKAKGCRQSDSPRLGLNVSSGRRGKNQNQKQKKKKPRCRDASEALDKLREALNWGVCRARTESSCSVRRRRIQCEDAGQSEDLSLGRIDDCPPAECAVLVIVCATTHSHFRSPPPAAAKIRWWHGRKRLMPSSCSFSHHHLPTAL